MPTPKQQLVQITAASYSRYTDYEKCPALAKYKHVERLKEPSNPALEKGNLIHALAQVWVSGKLPPREMDNFKFYRKLEAVIDNKKIPEELERFEEEFAKLRKVKAVCEQQWAFNEDWSEGDWFSKTAWLRIKVDAFWLEQVKTKKLTSTTVHIIDYKTGREYPTHDEQRSLYALGAFLMFPDVARVVAWHWYLDAGVERKGDWSSAAADGLKTYWQRNFTAMLNDRTFAPNPNPGCRYCHFRKSNQGPCEY